MKKLLDKFFDYFITTIVFFSPTVALSLYTYKSTREDEYRDSPRTVTDPGHRRVRVYDRFVLFTGYAIGIFIFFFNDNIFDLEMWKAAEDAGLKLISLVIFPQITGGWLSFVIWSGFFGFLKFYDKRRSKIIRDTNERLGVW